ncbi:MAG TPA: ABC transporter substrate-binding protein [Acidimicrobiales bacterium]|nr:ABC transporter substrate-binding protein [Acidimicrobiales bacterium]
MVDRLSRARQRYSGEGGFTLIELLVVIVILGVLAAVVAFSVGGIRDHGEHAAAATDAQIVRTAEEAYYAQNGHYADMATLVSGGFLAKASENTAVRLSAGNCPGPRSDCKFTVVAGVVNIAANADQWQVSDGGSGTGYNSSAFVYPLNSNLNEPLIIMNSDYTLRGGLAASWELIPKGTDRSTFTSANNPTPLPLPSTPTPYTACNSVSDRPYCNDTWRFHLRQGVTFHDGQPFDADDLIWTWRDRQPLNGSVADGENTLGFTRAPATGITPSTVSTAAQCFSGSTTDATRLCPYDSVEKIDQFTVDITPRINTGNLRFPEQVLHPKGAIVEVLRVGGVPVQAPAGEQTPGLSVPRLLGRHLDGSTGGIPSGSYVLGAGGTALPVAPTTLVKGTPQGTGPFKYLSYSPTNPQGGGSASFVANENYWGADKPQVQRMNYRFIADPAVRTAGLQSGQYDFVLDLNPLDVNAIQSSGRVVSAQYGQNALIYVNKVVKTSPSSLDFTKVGPATPAGYTFNIGTDPAVRKAASLAIDRAAIVTNIFAGNASPGRWMSPPGILGPYANTIVPAMATDVAQANTVLDNDGWTCQNAAPGLGTACNANEIRAWHGDARFTAGRPLTLYMVGISLVPQSEYDLLASQMKGAGINLVTERGQCDTTSKCTDNSVGRGQMYNSALWDFDLELPNQNDANAAFLPVLRQACASQSNFRFAPADGTNAVTTPVADTSANGGGTFPSGNTPCATTQANVTAVNPTATLTTPAILGPMDTPNTGYVAQSAAAATQDANQQAAANMMRILVGQNETNVVIPVVGQYRIYGMSRAVNFTDAHPSQTSQRWTSLSIQL